MEASRYKMIKCQLTINVFETFYRFCALLINRVNRIFRDINSGWLELIF